MLTVLAFCISFKAYLLLSLFLVILIALSVCGLGISCVFLRAGILLITLILILALILSLRFEGAFGADEAILSRGDQILAVRGDECLAYKGRVFGLAVLQKCTLEALFTRVAGNVNLFAREGIDSRSEHNCRSRAGRGVEILNLLGREVFALEVEREGDRVVQSRAGMA